MRNMSDVALLMKITQDGDVVSYSSKALDTPLEYSIN